MRKLGDLPAIVPVHLTSGMAMQVADTLTPQQEDSSRERRRLSDSVVLRCAA